MYLWPVMYFSKKIKVTLLFFILLSSRVHPFFLHEQHKQVHDFNTRVNTLTATNHDHHIAGYHYHLSGSDAIEFRAFRSNYRTSDYPIACYSCEVAPAITMFERPRSPKRAEQVCYILHLNLDFSIRNVPDQRQEYFLDMDVRGIDRFQLEKSLRGWPYF